MPRHRRVDATKISIVPRRSQATKQAQPPMPSFLLRIAQSRAMHGYQLNVNLFHIGVPHGSATVEFGFAMTPQDHEDIRWYLEDFIERYEEPAPAIAAAVEERLARLGSSLFDAAFSSSPSLAHVWAAVADNLADTRIEVRTDSGQEEMLPWELLRRAPTAPPIAVEASEFVRTTPSVSELATEVRGEALRVLLVISRPAGTSDVPFRSVANQLVASLRGSALAIQVEVLRPATADRLDDYLRRADELGRPYHIVHFDGHGDVIGGRGQVLFETERPNERELITGQFLAGLLVRYSVPVLVLNACRSATGVPAPSSVSQGASNALTASVSGFQSFAWDAIAAGLSAVLAMRYKVYVPTAARFMAGVYGALSRGKSLAGAVTLGRRELFRDRTRDLGLDVRMLQDWSVPALYENRRVQFLIEAPQAAPRPSSPSGDLASKTVDTDAITEDPGFFGRDETILRLERAFTDASIAILYGMGGMGKTAAAQEFGRWYRDTGGTSQPVLFTEFHRYRSLSAVLADSVAGTFSKELRQMGITWDTLSAPEQETAVERLFADRRMLWIWDNVESVTGLEVGVLNVWSPAESERLARFLRRIAVTEARVLLTSRKDERTWLAGTRSIAISIPPLALPDGAKLARRVAATRKHDITNIRDWLPVLEFAGGNPLTIQILVRQAVHCGVRDAGAIQHFVKRVSAGGREIVEGGFLHQDKALLASLRYGFNAAFTRFERRQVALVALFRTVVDAETLSLMGEPRTGWTLGEIQGINRADAERLLKRATDVGILGHRRRYRYTVHPALPWFLTDVMNAYYQGPRAVAAQRAFAGALGDVGVTAADQIQRGNRYFLEYVSEEELNFVNALRIALVTRMTDSIFGTVTALFWLYHAERRLNELEELLQEISPVIDVMAESLVPDRMGLWAQTTHLGIVLARERRSYDVAKRLIEALERRLRETFKKALANQTAALSPAERVGISWLCVALHEKGTIGMSQNDPACRQAFEEDFVLSVRIGDNARAAVTAFNAGQAFLTVPSMLDAAEAERWCKLSINLRDPRDVVGHARCHFLLARVERERALEAARRGESQEAVERLRSSAEWCSKCLAKLPDDALDERNVAHHLLGVILAEAQMREQAVIQYRESLRLEERRGNTFGAGVTRLHIAMEFLLLGRHSESEQYAAAALRDFVAVGDTAMDEAAQARALLAKIESDRRPAQGHTP
jgi:hypothetical protein